ncbi:hypothetical protein [Pelotalea chapellei]|uniref:Uncharacterized protein n=1 Tax=Pelotalea chapellei TaxID=44671 RepID=A0ABS5UCN8_9BACT|nr:hypothetical protein [Pelotalea chapellei]MBT1073246.1 hypothetical protein [Pelotalea chapellei]
MASLQTLLMAKGYYQCRYRDLIDIIRKVSIPPGASTDQEEAIAVTE